MVKVIPKIINRGANSVQCIIKRYQSEDRTINKARETLNKKLNAYDKRWVMQKENPKISVAKLTNKIERYLKEL